MMSLPPNWEISLERIARLLAKQNTERSSIPKEADTALVSDPSTAETTSANNNPNEPSLE